MSEKALDETERAVEEATADWDPVAEYEALRWIPLGCRCEITLKDGAVECRCPRCPEGERLHEVYRKAGRAWLDAGQPDLSSELWQEVVRSSRAFEAHFDLAVERARKRAQEAEAKALWQTMVAMCSPDDREAQAARGSERGKKVLGWIRRRRLN